MPSDRIEVSYDVVTPMFCGGADPTDVEIRVPSVKGVLRWWWRALAWSRLAGELSKVKAEEDALFGSASGGQSKVLMRLLPSTSPEVRRKGAVLEVKPGSVVGEGARYLGYGVIEAFGAKAGQLIRACLRAPFELKLELRARGLSEPQRNSLLSALKVMGVLGGVGAKSRKGYGSLGLRSLSLNGEQQSAASESADDLRALIRDLVATGRTFAGINALPPYTALSPRTRILLVSAAPNSSAMDLLDRVGREMMRFRSWGHNGFVLGHPSEKNFKEDHDLMKGLPTDGLSHPRRIVFGLPHNYGKPSAQQVGPATTELDRRASPLLIHIHKCGSTPVAVLALVAAQFLPGGDAARVSVGGEHVRLASESELWKPAHAFLDRLLDQSKRKEKFSQVIEVPL